MSRSSQPPKVILTRPLPSDKLEGGAILDKAEKDGLIELVRWDKEEAVGRQWLLDELRKGGTAGLVCMHNGEKVSDISHSRHLQAPNPPND